MAFPRLSRRVVVVAAVALFIAIAIDYAEAKGVLSLLPKVAKSATKVITKAKKKLSAPSPSPVGSEGPAGAPGPSTSAGGTLIEQGIGYLVFMVMSMVMSYIINGADIPAF